MSCTASKSLYNGNNPDGYDNPDYLICGTWNQKHKENGVEVSACSDPNGQWPHYQNSSRRVSSGDVNQLKCPIGYKPAKLPLNTSLHGNKGVINSANLGDGIFNIEKMDITDKKNRYFIACEKDYDDSVEGILSCCENKYTEGGDLSRLPLAQRGGSSFVKTSKSRCRYKPSSCECDAAFRSLCVDPATVNTNRKSTRCINWYGNDPVRMQYRDFAMMEYCKKHPDEPDCGCFKALDNKSFIYSYCKGGSCTATAYKTQEMLGVQCPDFVECIQKLLDAQGNDHTVITDNNLTQSCKGGDVNVSPTPNIRYSIDEKGDVKITDVNTGNVTGNASDVNVGGNTGAGTNTGTNTGANSGASTDTNTGTNTSKSFGMNNTQMYIVIGFIGFIFLAMLVIILTRRSSPSMPSAQPYPYPYYHM